MKTFLCNHCGNVLFFENVQCVNCGHSLGFLPDAMTLSTLDSAGDGRWQPQATPGRLYRNCANALQHKVCNWLVPASDPNPFCRSCRLNLVIPDLTVPKNVERWRKLEQAKRRVLFTLFSLGLSVEGNTAQNRPPLRFKFLSDDPAGKPVLTGHCKGEITVNIAEADEDERERRRMGLHEPYRTLVGHLRHEVAHYYWDQLIADTNRLDQFRKVFGDETQDYNGSLNAYYQKGPPVDWHKRYVSAYASAHPWEDWAETWAHYLHLVDTLETAAHFGLSLRFQGANNRVIISDPSRRPGGKTDFADIIANWLPLTTAVNSLNRGMGLPDLYPFVVSDAAIEKMKLIHEIVHTSELSQPAVVSAAKPALAEIPEMIPVLAAS